MRTERRDDLSWKRALWIGLGVSVAAHGVILAAGRFRVPAFGSGESARPLLLVQLPDDPPAKEKPLEVVEIAPGTGTPGGSPAAERLAALPAVPRIEASLASSVAPLATLLERVEDSEEKEPAAVAYASVTDFLADATPNPKRLRPIDDRPVDVLAGIAASRGRGGGVGGGHCPPGSPGTLRVTRAPTASVLGSLGAQLRRGP